LILMSKNIKGFEKYRSEISELQIQNIVLDKRQNALKVSANSIFGFFGVQIGGLLPLIEGAMSITAKGRELINEVNKYVQNKYNAKIVYNDTDSSMIDLNIKDPKECEYWGNRLVDEISGTKEKILPDGTIIPAKKGLFLDPLKMEFEKAMRLICIRKKKYAAYLIKKDGTFEKNKDGSSKILTKGIVLARRDNPPYLRKVYMELLKLVLDSKSIYEGFDCVVKSACDLICDRIPVKDNLTIVRELGANYKNTSYFLKVYSDELRRLGKPVNAGDRVVYVIVKSRYELEHPNEKILTGKKMRSIEAWLEEINTKNRENIDYMYYLEKIIINPIDQLFSIGYMRELKILDSHIQYESRHSRCNKIPISSPIKLLARMINDYLLDKNHTLLDIGYYIEDIMPKYFRQLAKIHL